MNFYTKQKNQLEQNEFQLTFAAAPIMILQPIKSWLITISVVKMSSCVRNFKAELHFSF